MTLCGCKVSNLKHWSNKLVIESKHLEEKLTILNMITLLIAVKLHCISNHLLFRDIFEWEIIWVIFIVIITRLWIVTIIEESRTSTVGATHWRANSTVGDSGWASLGTALVRHDTLALIFDFLELGHDFTQLPLSLLFLDGGLAYSKHSFSINEITCSGAPRVVTVDSLPILLEIGLDVLETI